MASLHIRQIKYCSLHTSWCFCLDFPGSCLQTIDFVTEQWPSHQSSLLSFASVLHETAGYFARSKICLLKRPFAYLRSAVSFKHLGGFFFIMSCLTNEQINNEKRTFKIVSMGNSKCKFTYVDTPSDPSPHRHYSNRQTSQRAENLTASIPSGLQHKWLATPKSHFVPDLEFLKVHIFCVVKTCNTLENRLGFLSWWGPWDECPAA